MYRVPVAAIARVQIPKYGGRVSRLRAEARFCLISRVEETPLIAIGGLCYSAFRVLTEQSTSKRMAVGLSDTASNDQKCPNPISVHRCIHHSGLSAIDSELGEKPRPYILQSFLARPYWLLHLFESGTAGACSTGWRQHTAACQLVASTTHAHAQKNNLRFWKPSICKQYKSPIDPHMTLKA